jgi:hypothetical protein
LHEQKEKIFSHEKKAEKFSVGRQRLIYEGKTFSRGEVKPLSFFSLFILRLKNKNKKPSVG